MDTALFHRKLILKMQIRRGVKREQRASDEGPKKVRVNAPQLPIVNFDAQNTSDTSLGKHRYRRPKKDYTVLKTNESTVTVSDTKVENGHGCLKRGQSAKKIDFKDVEDGKSAKSIRFDTEPNQVFEMGLSRMSRKNIEQAKAYKGKKGRPPKTDLECCQIY